jgi:glycosyltransferase involved in cell wall biosynthesis
MNQPLVSICIPAYKKPEYVVRCIESVLKQTYKQVEIVISDDSPNQDIKLAIESYNSSISINYYHNHPALKSPINWNNALNKAKGSFYMLMHQDDWFETDTAIETYIKAFEANPQVDFVFCRNTAIQPDGQVLRLQAIPSLLDDMQKHPNHLVRANVIGPPSNTMLRSKVSVRYDEAYIWLVDVDYYVQLLEAGHSYNYLDAHLVSIGLHEDQTTVFCRNNEDVIIKENIWFATKIGNKAFKDILIYDYYWRLLRNYKIRSVNDITITGVHEQSILLVIHHMLGLQQNIPLSILKMGIISKTLMFFNYLLKPNH